MSIRDIVEATGLAKTTVIRLVQTLEQNGLLWAAPNGYLAGPGLWRWAHLARSSWELPPETQKLMRDLGARRRETVNLYMLRDIYRVCVAQQESPQPLRHVVHVGDELPLWAGASSKVLLRDAPESLLTRIARSSPYGEGHVKRLTEWIEEAAHQGWAVSHGEREDGLSAVAVPVLGRSGGGRRRAVPERPHRPFLRRPGRTVRRRTCGRPPSTCPNGASTTRSARRSDHTRRADARRRSQANAGTTAQRSPGTRPDQRARRAVLQLPADAARRRGRQGRGAGPGRPGPAPGPGPGAQRGRARARPSSRRTPGKKSVELDLKDAGRPGHVRGPAPGRRRAPGELPGRRRSPVSASAGRGCTSSTRASSTAPSPASGRPAR